MARADLLLEIGTEEIPAGYLPGASKKLAHNITSYLKEAGIEFDAAGTEIFAAPRRLAVLIPGVDSHQPKRTEQRLGPAVKAAFDGDGNPTRAAEGFARSVGAAVAQLERVATEKGERLALEVEVGGAATRDLLLADDFTKCLLSLGFPKTMRWIPGNDLAFARPIRWLVCLLGSEVIPLRLAELEAGNQTRGHRTLAPAAVTLKDAGAYVSALESAFVLTRPGDRRRIIDEQAHALAEQAGGRLHEAADLMQEVTYLTEHPRPVLGSFDPTAAQALPREVVITALRSHQRYFCIEQDDGSLLPRFITFRDGGDEGLDNVVEGNERVLRARLDDALFYWNEDRALSSDDKLQRLDRIVWLEGFGSMGDKSRRIESLALSLKKELELDLDEAALRRGALLCKTDLATEMIRDGKEFTKLQGVMGRYYALEAGEPAAVADLIAEHLHPRFADDRLPEGDAAACVAVADRLDTIAGCVLAGLAPTGSQDPYALRRGAAAILRIAVERGWHLDLESWARQALAGFSSDTTPEALETVVQLFWGRLETQLSDLPAEIVRAVLSVSVLDPLENVRAARALAEFAEADGFAMLLEGAKRCRNILVKEERLPEEELGAQARAAALRQAAAQRWGAWQKHAGGGDPPGFVADVFEEPAEGDLHGAILQRAEVLDRAQGQGAHAQVYESLSELGAPIDRYFNDVLVNSKDKDQRANRLAFLESIHYLFARFADLSRIPGRTS